MDKIVALCKRRGFIYPGSEIYGGLAGTWDYGPLGVELKNNIKQAWWKRFVQLREDIVGLDAALIMNPRVWEASGHVAHFSDPLIECKKCHKRMTQDHLKKAYEEFFRRAKGGGISKTIALSGWAKEALLCIDGRHKQEDFTSPKMFNLMFKTFIGPAEETANIAYLRPETAQAIFVNFKNIIDTTRIRVPFGVAQIGKAFRNEITIGNFVFRAREFEQMEIEFFIPPPEKDEEWERVFEMWRKEMWDWIEHDLGLDKSNLEEYNVPAEERSHYSKKTIDFKYKFPFGTEELYGLAYRGDYDLSNHANYLSNAQKDAGEPLKYQDPESEKKYFPHVIEPSLGVDRSVLVVLLDAYTEKEGRVFLKLHPKLAPFKVAVFPLLANKEELVKKAKDIYIALKKDFMVAWDERGNIGGRYASQDEIGTPYCVTLDFQSLEDEMVTVRDRDTTKQERVKIVDLRDYLHDKIEA